jgi:hypothetical protein
VLLAHTTVLNVLMTDVFAAETESTHQLVTVDHTTMMMVTVIAQSVTINVTNVPLMKSVLIVLETEEKPLQIVHVHQVPMKTTLKNVHHVLIHVPPVLLMKVVKPVKKTESTHQPVTVKMDTMLLNTNVTYVLTDVSLVNLTNGTVPIVPKTELKNHIAVAQPVTSIMVWKILSVIHVLHNVSPVLVLLTIVIPVPETESVQMNVHVQWLP